MSPKADDNMKVSHDVTDYFKDSAIPLSISDMSLIEACKKTAQDTLSYIRTSKKEKDLKKLSF